MKHFFRILYILILLFTIELRSQEEISQLTNIFAGCQSIIINPASQYFSPYIYDVHLIGTSTYLDNTYIYAYKANIFKLAGNTGNLELANMSNKLNNVSSPIMLYSRSNALFGEDIQQSLYLQGPSIFVPWKEWHFAFSTAMRNYVSAITDANTASLFYNGVDFYNPKDKDINVGKFRVNQMLWEEYTFNIGHRSIKTILHEKRFISIGISYKFLRGRMGNYFLHDHSNFNSSAGFNPSNLNSSFGYGYTNNDVSKVSGIGHSLDIGISIEDKRLEKHTVPCRDFCNLNEEVYYNWRLGASILDLGFINFNNNVFTRQYDAVYYNWKDYTNGFDMAPKLDLSTQSTKNSFIMLPPTALSVQFDKRIHKFFYVNLTWIQRVPHFGIPGVDRANTISLIPRYDSQQFGVSLPIILYQYQYPRIGFSFHLYNKFFMGTNMLNSLIGTRVPGVDFYFGIKINAFRKCK